MGWCGGTKIFDAVAEHFFGEPPKGKFTQRELNTLQVVAEALKDADWDCEADSDYADVQSIRHILKMDSDE